MIDYAAMDQGSGLRQLALRSEPTVLTMLQHGDRVAELTLLWQVCSALQNYGYTVTVLDGTAEESEANPGLLNMLEEPYAPSPLQDCAKWTVIPSARGLKLLGNLTADMQARLSNRLSDSAVWVVYASAEALGMLQKNKQNYRPVVALSPETTSLLSAYQGIKDLALMVRLSEVIAVTVNPLDTPEYLATGIAKSLQNCTMNFLKCPVRHVSTQLKNQESSAAELAPESIRQLALQLLGLPVQASSSQVAESAVASAGAMSASTRPKVAHDHRLWSR